MQTAPSRPNEAETLEALRALEVLDTAPEAEFDTLVRVASQVCGVPISLISLVDSERQWFKANVGLEGVTQTHRDLAFCAHAVNGLELMEVPDASQDARFFDNPLVREDPYIRFYAGVPLQLQGGEVVGTLCVIDREPRQLSATQREVLRDLASVVVSALVRRKAAESLLQSEVRYRTLVEDQSELISLATPDGMLTFVNSAYARAFGQTPDAMIGQSLYDFVPEAQRDEVREFLTTLCASGGVAHGENQMVQGDGKVHWVAWTNRAMTDALGVVNGVHSVGRDITDRKEVEHRLEEKRDRIANILDGTHAGTWEWQIATGKVIFNERWASMLGYTLEELTPLSIQTWTELLHPEDAHTSHAELARHFAGELEVYECDVRMRHQQGHWVWVQTRGRVLSWMAPQQPDRMFGTHIDITPRKLAEEAQRRLTEELTQQHELLRVTLQSIGDAVITTDAHGMVTWLNPVAERMTGWLATQAQGLPLAQVFHIVNEETRASTENPVATCLEQGKIVGLANHTLLISRDGSEFGIEDSAAPIRNQNGEVQGVVLVFHDVSEQRRLSGEMTFRATHDALTGLFNRSEFESRLLRVLRNAYEEQSHHAMLYIDLDQFKLVNDACGHAVGDQLLIQVSKLLGEAIRTRDTLARLGGDEFAVILEYCSTEQAEQVAQKICNRMDDFRFLHDGKRFRIGASIGLVPINRNWINTAAIQQAADAACYAAKEAGRNRVHAWFDTDAAMRSRQFEMQWTSRIERALDEGGFKLFAQRIEALQTEAEGMHAEVLLRMRNDDGTLTLPGLFLPSAERFHLISRVDRWVLKATITWMQKQTSLNAMKTLSVNLSGQSVGDRVFHSWATDVLREAGPDICARLCLEITETAAVTNLADAAIFIEKVRALGVRVALDDFGAGASSFGYLKSLQVDYLKIDGQFVRDLVSDPLDDVAVRCFVDVATVVGVQTVGEYVDHPAVLKRLREIGVDYAQGYLIHEPEPIDQIFDERQANFESTYELQAQA